MPEYIYKAEKDLDVDKELKHGFDMALLNFRNIDLVEWQEEISDEIYSNKQLKVIKRDWILRRVSLLKERSLAVVGRKETRRNLERKVRSSKNVFQK